MKLAMTCPHCGSADIAQVNCDARWSVEAQAWIAGDAESHICDDCEREFDAPNEIEISEQKEAA